jgi:RNA polymerase sigma-70 factor (ECF subfamily)
VAGDDDGVLARAAASGDLRAFEQLYRNHVTPVYRLCLRMTGDPQRADELTQDVFVRVWSKLKSFKGNSAFSTWLYRVAVNVVLGDRRARGRESSRLRELDPSIQQHEAPRDRQPDLAVDLQRAIRQLPPRARLVFVLHDVEGRRHQEVAELTGMAVGSSKAQLHRARRLLREVLQ